MRSLHRPVFLSVALVFVFGCANGGFVSGGAGGGVGGSSTSAGGSGQAQATASGAGEMTAASTTGKGATSTSATATATTAAATTAAATTATTSSGGSMDPAQLCVDAINSYRATRGLPPYARWTSNETCVSQEAQTDEMMMTAHYAFGHGQSCGAYAQDECPGYSTNPLGSPGVEQCLAQMWAEKDKPECAGCGTCDFPYQGCTNCTFSSCGHYLNMKSAYFSHVACGFSSGASSGWYAQNFN